MKILPRKRWLRSKGPRFELNMGKEEMGWTVTGTEKTRESDDRGRWETKIYKVSSKWKDLELHSEHSIKPLQSFNLESHVKVTFHWWEPNSVRNGESQQ